MSVAAWLDHVDKCLRLSPRDTSGSLPYLFVLNIQDPIVSSLQNDILDVCTVDESNLVTANFLQVFNQYSKCS